jgi:hypothetical protein
MSTSTLRDYIHHKELRFSPEKQKLQHVQINDCDTLNQQKEEKTL